MNCPNCQTTMLSETLEGHLGASVAIDRCDNCQTFWFDTRENLQLSPGSVLRLFRIIGERTDRPRPTIASKPACPRCSARLLLTHDRQRNTPFQYMRCPKGHGRLVVYLDFLREKDFVRPLSAAQIAELRQNVQTVNCANCGAPIDLAKETICAHCRSPLSMLDMKQAGALLADLRQASQPREIDPTLPLRLERARRDVEAAFASPGHGGSWIDDVSGGGLVGASLRALFKLIDS